MDPAGSNPLPEFLFFYLPSSDWRLGAENDVLTPANEALVLYEDEDDVSLPEEELLGVVESARAERGGVAFERSGNGVYRASSLPVRYIFSAHGRYERQVSAGGVLARGSGQEAEFALMRTLPRKEAAARAREEAEEPADVEDPRGEDDRRANDRRREKDSAPSGKERRRGRSRRMRRRRRSSRWGPDGRLELPKGKLEPGETTEQAAVREVREELGISGPIQVRRHLSKNHYCFRTPDGKAIFKTVHYYLLVTTEAEPTFSPRTEEGIVSVEWWRGERAIQQVAFPNLKPVLERAWELLQQ